MITVLVIAFYLPAMTVTARVAYRFLRPYTEPLNCRQAGKEYHAHGHYCYNRFELIGPLWARLASAVIGALWPASVIVAGFLTAMTSGVRPRPAEIAARTLQLEKEMGI